jgi:hypothetical protein
MNLLFDMAICNPDYFDRSHSTVISRGRSFAEFKAFKPFKSFKTTGTLGTI